MLPTKANCVHDLCVKDKEVKRKKKHVSLTNKSIFSISRGIHRIPKVNFTNILQLFLPISFRQKITNSNYKFRKAAYNTFRQKAARKMLVKMIPDVIKGLFE